MKYEVVEYEIDGVVEQSIVITNEDGSQLSFAAVDTNPNYVAWLETEEGKAYLASQKASK